MPASGASGEVQKPLGESQEVQPAACTGSTSLLLVQQAPAAVGACWFQQYLLVGTSRH